MNNAAVLVTKKNNTCAAGKVVLNTVHKGRL